MFSTDWVNPESSFIESFVWRTNAQIEGDNPDLDQEGDLIIWIKNSGDIDEYCHPEIEYSEFLNLKRLSELGESVGSKYNTAIKENPDYPPANKLK